MKNHETEHQVINALHKSTDILLKDTPVCITEEAGGISKQSIGVIENGTIKILPPAEAYFASEAHQNKTPKQKPVYLTDDHKASNFYIYSTLYDAPTLQLGSAIEGDHTIVRIRNDDSSALEQYGYHGGTAEDEEISRAQGIFSDLGLLAVSAGQLDKLNELVDHLSEINSTEIDPGLSRKIRSELFDTGLAIDSNSADNRYHSAAPPDALATFRQRLVEILHRHGVIHAEQRLVIPHKDITITLWRKLYVARAASLGRLVILPTKPQLAIDYKLDLHPEASDVYDSVTRCVTVDSDQSSVYFEVYESDAKKLKARVKELEETWQNTRELLDPNGVNPKQYVAYAHAQARLRTQQLYGESDARHLNLPGLRQTVRLLGDVLVQRT